MNGSMEQSPPQNLMRGLPHAPVDPGSLPPEYWESLYANPEPPHQHAHPPQQQLQQSQQPQQPPPMGINWDSPVFAQTPQQRGSLPLQQEQGHGLYPSSTAQSWRANPLHPQQIMPSTPQGFAMPVQYRQVPQYSQGQVPFESQSLNASDNPSYQPYSFPRNYYPAQHISLPDTFSQTPTPQASQPQPSQSAPYQSNTAQTPIVSYTLPTGFSEETSHGQMQYTNEFSDSAPTVHEHQTINPQFLNTPQQANNQHASLNNFIYVNPPGFERQDSQRTFDYFRNDLQMPSLLNRPTANGPGVPGTQAPGVEVAIPMNRQQQLLPNTSAKPGKKQTTLKKVTKKPAAKASTKKPDGRSASSGSETDTSDSELEIEAPEEQFPLSLVRPNEPEAAAQYDALRAVWSPRNRRPHADKVKGALVAFKDVVKAVRDTWKEKSQTMKMAENKGENDKAAQIKKDVVLQRRLMDVVISTTLDQGHPTIVEKLGEHPMAVAAMYSFLLDRHQASDIDGAFTLNLLRLLARFVTMDEDVLQKTNVAKLLPRFVKKGGQVAKGLAQKILDNAATSTKRKQEGSKAAPKEASPGVNTVPNVALADGQRTELAGSKRPRDAEANGQPATKRMVVTSNLKGNQKPTNGPVTVPAKRPQETGQEAVKPAAAATSRPKANIIAPKPTNLFGSLSSASKRPGTSNAERAAAAAAAAKSSTSTEKKESQPAPPRPTFSFGDIMADLNKQKESPPSEPAENKPPETEEERKMRLRKEARRKLRVTWKPDESLTEVRLFTHDPDEELGPGDHAQREAGDVKGEGSVLKLHRDLDEYDEEEDGGVREESLRDYYEPSEIDFADITPEDRSRNNIKRAGTQQPTSAEKEAQEHREATTLMVFYTSAADVPPSPKEPPPPSDDEPVAETVALGELPDHVKVRQERYFSAINPLPTPTPTPAQPQPSTQSNQFDISNLLKIIQNAPQQQSTPPPPPPPVTQAPMSDLERTVSMFRQQQPPQQPPQPPAQPFQMPRFPATTQAPATQGLDFQKILAVLNAQKQMQQPPPVIPPVQPSQPAIAPNLAAFISQFAGANQQSGPNPSQMPGQFDDPERKRTRDGPGFDGSEDDRYGYFKRNKPNGPNKSHPKVGLVPCRYWPEGKCRKGNDCTFRHDPLN
ncbi:hypothetical protein BDV38DRAFT_120290 [Aspergillus pseudotamarii]|uniref:C3H1-type domain-containing protein n=1 Tax=Aspergillus pseudotamarii TaxID=132259 RepID=A0A5N6SMK3_ASPPS|nr:uncharacterized protein BDV38DRAFT_120290 [Aspergillus pseudotamarii]KAE8135928.1 hypothetical protein BDV38DRAFT_120290 [Aspergillus pseudotamarii]